MIPDALKRLWDTFIAPMRPRRPIPPWRHHLLRPSEKQQITEKNTEIRREVRRLESELALIDRDHGKG